MRLSDAIALGRTVMSTVEPTKFCGCAIGMGVTALRGAQMDDTDAAFRLAVKKWPWLKNTTDEIPSIAKDAMWEQWNYPVNKNSKFHEVVSAIFFNVYSRRATLDQLIDWVRSVEPAEVEPALAESCNSAEVVHEKP